MTTTQTPTGSPPTIVPAPRGVTATINSTAGITISWEAVAGATSYSVHSSTTDNSAGATLLASGVTGTSYNDTSNTLGSIVYYWVKATTAAGTSGFSGVATGWRVRPAPAAPTGIDATDTDFDKVAVTWTPPSSDADYLLLLRSPDSDPDNATLRISLAFNAASYDDTTAVMGTTYHYFVYAVNYIHGLSSGATTTGLRPLVAPSAPTGVTASDGLFGYTTVSWTASAYATSYEVWREPYSGGSNVKIADGITTTSYDDTTGETKVDYIYTVKAVNGAGTSAASSGNVGYRYADARGLTINGGDAAFDKTYYVDAGSLPISFAANAIADQLQIYFNGSLSWDTGCVTGTTSTTLYPGVSGTLRIVVTPNCAGGSGTAWTVNL